MKWLIYCLLTLFTTSAFAQEALDPTIVADDVIHTETWQTSYEAGAFQTAEGMSALVSVCERAPTVQACLTGVGFGPTLDATLDVYYVFRLAEDIDLKFGTGVSAAPVLVLLADLILLMADAEPLWPLPPTQIFLRTELTVHLPLNRKHGLAMSAGIGYHAASNHESRFPRGIAASVRGGFTRRHLKPILED